MKPTTSLTCASIAAIIAGCAAAPPPELRDARAENHRAANGIAAQLAPAELHAARDQLALAERSFRDRGDDYRTRALAYSAERKARLAEVRAETRAAGQTRADPRAEVGRTKIEALHTTSAELSNVRTALARVAVVREEPRGIVITLPVSSLFDPGESGILPEARAKLDRIARVLSRQGTDASFEVDARTLAGDPDISVKRADAVRTYLDARGVPADRIRTAGLAPDGENADVQIVVHTP